MTVCLTARVWLHRRNACQSKRGGIAHKGWCRSDLAKQCAIIRCDRRDSNCSLPTARQPRDRLSQPIDGVRRRLFYCFILRNKFLFLCLSRVWATLEHDTPTEWVHWAFPLLLLPSLTIFTIMVNVMMVNKVHPLSVLNSRTHLGGIKLHHPHRNQRNYAWWKIKIWTVNSNFTAGVAHFVGKISSSWRQAGEHNLTPVIYPFIFFSGASLPITFYIEIAFNKN